MNRQRTFFLETTPEEGAPRLTDADQQHALRVLRVSAGDVIEGIDGRGRAWQLDVLSADRRRLELAPRGPLRHEPALGTAGAPLPWIEVCTPLPKGNRAELVLGALTQLGLARLVPLVTEHCESQARQLPARRLARLERSSQEALKQCGRLWLPEIAHQETLAELLKKPARRAILDPRAELTLSGMLASMDSDFHPTQEEPFQLVFGPEGGLSSSELELLTKNGARGVRISAHILRMETALQGALAIVAEWWIGRS